MAILEELKHRGVIQTAALYIAIAWGGTEILTFLIEALWGEDWASAANKYFAILFIAGFQQLDEGLRHHSPNMIFLRTAPVYDPIREDPRFQAILDQMDFPS